MICACGTKLVWGGDNNFDELGVDGIGIAKNYTCPKCGAWVEAYFPESEP